MLAEHVTTNTPSPPWWRQCHALGMLLGSRRLVKGEGNMSAETYCASPYSGGEFDSVCKGPKAYFQARK